jgi:hypothetical protein
MSRCDHLQRLIPVVFAAGQHRLGYASQLVGDGDHDFIAGSTLSQPQAARGYSKTTSDGPAELHTHELPLDKSVAHSGKSASNDDLWPLFLSDVSEISVI